MAAAVAHVAVPAYPEGLDVVTTPAAVPLKQLSTTYHQDKNAQYVLPNNSLEHVRLEEQAALIAALMHGRVVHAPVKDGKNVRMLDIGCGTGVVTYTMADTFPQTECIGVDLSVVPSLRSQKSNVRFFQGNVSTQGASQWAPNDMGAPLPQDQQLFDYVFSRLLILGMSNWPAYIQTQYNLLKPGGWAEVHDLDWEFFNEAEQSISGNWTWLRTLSDICEGKKGMDFHCGSRTAQWMEEAGFLDIQVVRYKWSYGKEHETDPAVRAWSIWHTDNQPELVGMMIERSMTAGLGAGLVTREVIDEMQREMRRTLEPEKGKHKWFYVTIGRKPEL